jgi:hypothetical protein
VCPRMVDTQSKFVGMSLTNKSVNKSIGDSQLCFLRCDDISDEDSTMCLLDGGNR